MDIYMNVRKVLAFKKDIWYYFSENARGVIYRLFRYEWWQVR